MASSKIIALIFALLFLAYSSANLLGIFFTGPSLTKPKSCRNVADYESEYYILHFTDDPILDTNAILAKRSISSLRSVNSPRFYDFISSSNNIEILIQVYYGGGFILYDNFFYYRTNMCVSLSQMNIVIKDSRSNYALFFLEPMSSLGKSLLKDQSYSMSAISSTIARSDLKRVIVLKTKQFNGCETAFYYDIPVVATSAKCKYKIRNY